MEASKEAISVRVSRLNGQLLGKNLHGLKSLITREGLLDALTVLYDECNTDALKRGDKYIASFVNKFRVVISELKRLRVSVSDFEVKDVVGRGHFGIVHVVREKQTGDVYAMKTIRKSDTLNQQSASYAEERDIMASSRSPWLTLLQYAFQDAAHLYLVMEFHPGGDLCGLLDRQGGTLLEAEARFYLAELTQAVNALHLMGFVHRDVKPDNVLLGRCGHLKLADFGSAAKLEPDGTVSDKNVISVGTPDYVAPEVLQSNDKVKNRKITYGCACDYWSIGVLAYELTIGSTPFCGPTVAITYNKIMNHATHLKFPNDAPLTEAYISFIRSLLTDQDSRLNYKQILDHALFKETDWTSLREQVPPFVPIVNGVDDTSNFLDVEAKKSTPSIDNFKTKSQFSGRNLPFIGFTYTQDANETPAITALKRNEETLLESRKMQVENLQKRLAKVEYSSKECEVLERKVEEYQRRLESVEGVRNGLEKELASSLAKNSALHRTLESERRERKELETRALELIKTTKQKWETAEKERVCKLNEVIDQQNTRITELCTNNNELTSKLQRFKTQLEQTETELERLRESQVDSLAKARVLNRQSIAGVENRLERMTIEAQSQITELQAKLSEALESKNQLDLLLEKHRKHEQDLEDQTATLNDLCTNLKKHLDESTTLCSTLEHDLHQLQTTSESTITQLRIDLRSRQSEIAGLRNDVRCAQIEEALKREQSECRTLKRRLSDLEASLNKSVEVVKECEAKRDADVRVLRAQFEEATTEREKLCKELLEAQQKDASNKLKVQGLEQLVARLESGVTKLETNSDRDTCFQEQVKRLEDQIRELHESSALDKQELRTVNATLWRKEKELSNCVLDKRIVERELKTAESAVQKMEEEVKKLNETINEQKQMHEEALNDVKQMNEASTAEIKHLKDTAIQSENSVEEYKQKYEDERKSAVEMQKELTVALKNIESIREQLQSEMKAKRCAEKHLQKMREDNIKLNHDLSVSKHNEFTTKQELEKYRRELANAQFNLNVMHDGCTLLEKQLEDFESLIAEQEAKQKAVEQTVTELTKDLTESKSETVDTKRALNETRSLKLLAESQCQKLQEDVDLLRHECASYKDQVEQYRKLSSDLSEDLAVTEERCSDLEMSLKAVGREVEKLNTDNVAVKEESAQRLTNIHKIREANYKLSQELLDAKDENTALITKLVELEASLNEQNNYYKQRDLKSEATIQQQTKLIDFLQSKIQDGKKKKTLSDKLFGSSKKENLPPSLAFNYRDLESMLAKERESNKNLREQIIKLKSETIDIPRPNETEVNKRNVTPPNSPRTQLALEQLVRSPASQNGDFQRKPSIQRMHHNIPHRFESRLCKKVTKCANCSESIQLGRTASVCKECSITAHSKCAEKIPRTCGLPKELAKHFTRTLSNSATKIECKENTGENVSVEGWLKIQLHGKSDGWKKKYVRLEDTILAIYEHEPTNNLSPVETLELCPSDGWVSVTDELQAHDVNNTASADLPFIIQVEVHPTTTCWPTNSHLLMTLNAADKEKWFQALTDLFQKKYPENSRNNYTTIVKLGPKMDVACVEELSKEILLIGCEQGLFSLVRGNPLLNILGPLKIQQIGILKTINTVLLIAGDASLIYRSELRQLDSLAKCAACSNPTLKTSPLSLNNKTGFHLFRASETKQIICAATTKQFFIIRYDFELDDFIPLRMLDTAEPSSCILFNDHSVIVGANKFFEIDLKTFAADEFLDPSDHKLKHAVNCYKLGSYPVSILLINNNPVEYLLCFSEFGVFVDAYGGKNRENDLKWSHLPLAFSYCAPFLYVVQFAAVEIIRITPDTYDDTSLRSWLCPDSIRLEFVKPIYLGQSRSGIYIGLPDEIIFINAKAICGEESLTDLESNGSEQDGSEFSFTSSVVNSLDRGSIDSDNEKRVQFSDL